MPEITLTSKLQLDNDASPLVCDDRKTMIKVDHVSMVFNMASEKLSSLKEYAIAILKRQLFFEKFTALDDISFEVKKGDVFGILGTNGSGKSTLLKIIAGVLEPTKGSCEINGNIAPLIELGAGFDMELSARENIYLNGSLLGYSKDFINEHFDDIVEFAEIEKFLDMPMKNYSSGMIARIAFAIATVIVPEILIVDEVLSVGDFMFQQKCENRINELIEKYGVTVLIVSHSNDQIERLCNKAIWIEKGHTRTYSEASKVVELYKFLGGRRGSQPSEDIILKTLEAHNHQHGNQNTVLKRIYGSNSINTNLRQIELAWDDKEYEAIALACNFTHTNSVMANGFCGALDIPVLPINHSELDSSLREWICSKSPSRIYIFDRGEKIDNEILKSLSDLPFSPKLIYVGKSLDMVQYSNEVFTYGSSLDLWHNSIALIMFDENPESLAASPFIYKSHLPVYFMRSEKEDLSNAIELWREHNIENVIIFGKLFPNEQKTALENEGFIIENIGGIEAEQDSCEDISLFTYNFFNESNAANSVIIADKSLSSWPNLLSTGCVGGKQTSTLILCDCEDLDSIANCINNLRDCRFTKGITITGDNKVLNTESTLFDTVLLSNRINS